MTSPDAGRFDPVEVAANHRRLVELAAATLGGDVQAVLNLGAAVLLHAALEPAHLARVLTLVDPSVREELRDQHDQLERDMQFLRELARGEPDSGDLELMSQAVLERIRHHLDRDQRTLYGPMARLRDVDAAPHGSDAEPRER